MENTVIEQDVGKNNMPKFMLNYFFGQLLKTHNFLGKTMPKFISHHGHVPA